MYACMHACMYVYTLSWPINTRVKHGGISVRQYSTKHVDGTLEADITKQQLDPGFRVYNLFIDMFTRPILHGYFSLLVLMGLSTNQENT